MAKIAFSEQAWQEYLYWFLYKKNPSPVGLGFFANSREN